MVISDGIATNRVPIPKIKNIEQNTSAETVSANGAVAPMPIGPGNYIGPSPNNVENLPVPAVNIKMPATKRSSFNTKK